MIDDFGACIHICAKNDSNGNPRRAYIIINKEGQSVKAIDEGYAGISVVRGELPPGYHPPSFDVELSEYLWARVLEGRDKK